MSNTIVNCAILALESPLSEMSTNDRDVISEALPKVAASIRSASGLAAYDIGFYKRLDKTVLDSSESSSDRLLKLINIISTGTRNQDTSEFTGDIVENSWSQISNLLDSYLERSDIAFDSLRSGSTQKESTQNLTYLDDGDVSNRGAHVQKTIDKPQVNFKTPIDNSEKHPFKPLLTSKPNALVPFEETFMLTTAEENDPSHYKQPYETEILNQEYNPSILKKDEPIPSTDWQQTDSIWVDNLEELQKMLSELKKASEIAVDLEHHDYRSYYGLVCLMQISTRTQDWLIDTLALREDLQILNVVFTDPKITKVFHGAFMDIIWLQRDLGLYVVSLFDTYHASRLLGFPKHSLAYLLERFAQFKTSKKYQLADWRIRPLTNPMKLYARSDTHFLLNIFDQLRNMLLEQDKLTTVLFESRNVAKRRFEYSSFRPSFNNHSVVSPIEKAEPWKNLLYQYNLPHSRESIVRTLYEWRDQIARADDESPRYVMPNQLLVSLAASAPTVASAVLSSSNMVSDHVRKHCKEIAIIIDETLKESEKEDLELLKDLSENGDNQKQITTDQVKISERIFTSLAHALKLQTHHHSFSKHSVLLAASDLNKGDSDDFFFSGDDNQIMSSEKHNRAELINQALLYQYHPEVIEAGTEDHQDGVAVDESTEEDADSEVKVNRPTLFDNSEEVVVLKKKKQSINNSKTQSRNNSNTSKELIDYEKSEKVMRDVKLKDKNSKKRSSSTFDPYSKESEGPKPAKKQVKLQAGKNSSFVTRRK